MEKKGKVTVDKLAQYYASNVRFAASSENVTKSFIESAFPVFTSMLSDSPTLDLLRQGTDEWGTAAPLNSVYKMQLVVTRAEKDTGLIQWIVAKIHDECKSGLYAPAEFTFKFLKLGMGSSKGHLDLVIMKHRLLHHCLYSDLPTRCRDNTINTKVVKCLKDLVSYRTNVAPLGADADVDMTWKASLPPSVKKALTLYETLIYESDFDTALKVCVRAQKTPQECLSHGSIGDVVSEIAAAAQEESAKKAPPLPQLNNSAPASDDQKVQSLDSEAKDDEKSVVPSLDDMTDKPAVSLWLKHYASKKVHENVKLVADPGTLTELVAALTNTITATMKGDVSGHVLIHLDLNLSGESKTAPHVRTAPFRKDLMTRLITAVTSLRTPDPDCSCVIQPGDVYVYLDGGKAGATIETVNRLFVKARGRYPMVCQAEGLTKKVVTIFLDEESVKARRCRTKTLFASLNQIHGIHIYMNSDTHMPEQPHVVYPGSNCGNVLGPVKLEEWSKAFKLPIVLKHQVYGEYRRAVGGRTDGGKAGDDAGDDIEEVEAEAEAMAEAEDESRPSFMLPAVMPGRGKNKPRPKVAHEPFAWNAMPQTFYQELTSSYFARAVIDLTPGSGLFASHCLMNGIPYVGVCMKEGKDGAEHKVVLHDELVRMYLSKMCEEGSPLYSPKYANFMIGTTPHVTPPVAAPKTAKKKVVPAVDVIPEDGDGDEDGADSAEETPAPPARAGTSLAALLADIK